LSISLAQAFAAFVIAVCFGLESLGVVRAP